MQCRCNWHRTFPAGLARKAVPRNVATVLIPLRRSLYLKHLTYGLPPGEPLHHNMTRITPLCSFFERITYASRRREKRRNTRRRWNAVRKRSFRLRFQRPVAPTLAHSEGRLTVRAVGLKVNSHTNVASMSNSIRLTKHHNTTVSFLPPWQP